jgi:hypothetical protein
MRKFTKTQTIQDVEILILIKIDDEAKFVDLIAGSKDGSFVTVETFKWSYDFEWNDYFIFKKIIEMLNSKDLLESLNSYVARFKDPNYLKNALKKEGFLPEMF